MDRENVQTDWEEVARRKPDVALIVWTGVPTKRIRKERITGRTAWQGKPFVRENRIHILEEGWFCRPSPRLLTGIEYLAHLLYPDTFSPPDPDAPLGRDWALKKTPSGRAKIRVPLRTCGTLLRATS